MKLTQKLLKGGGQLAVGQIISQGSSLCRNILLARLLVPENFGLATTFMLTLSMLEMLSNMSAEMLLVQSRNGGSASFLRAMHGFVLIRGATVSLVIFLSASSIANLFHASEIIWAFQVLALAPLIKAFVHLGYKQSQRQYDFKSELWVECLPQVGAVILLYPLSMFDSTETIGLWVVLIQMIIFVVTSHVIARNKYRASFDFQVFRQVVSFGLPLVASALLMFFAIQGDRFLVGHYYSAEQFGIFSAIALLVMSVCNAISKFSTSLMLPVLSRAGEINVVSYLRMFDIAIMTLSAVAMLFMLIFGERFITLLYGGAYQLPGVIDAFAFLLGFRLLRFPITVYYISLGDTVVPFVANVVRFLGVLIAFQFAYFGEDIRYVIASGALGEFLAYLMARLVSVKIVGSIFRAIIVPTAFGVFVSIYYIASF